MKRVFKLTDLQVDYILDTRLRALRKLEEMELRSELDALSEERTEIESLLADEVKQWKTIATQVRELKKTYGPTTPRRQAPHDLRGRARGNVDFDLAEAMIEREPITVVVSKKGWIRALKGHVQDLSSLQFKGDDGLDTSFFAQTTSKILVLATNGKAYTLDASKLPGGRGHGEPIRLFADIDEGADVVARHAAWRRRVAAARHG